MSEYAQIPTPLICRFGELSKTEIVVVSYLYSTRNRKSGRCNPSQATISRAVGIGKSHVSEAVKSLDKKGWIIEELDGNFELVPEPKKVPESGTKKFRKTEPKVPELGTIVPESGTQSSGIGNSYIKDSSEQRNEQKKEQRGNPPARVTLSHPVIEAIRIVTKTVPPRECWTLLANKIGVDVDVGRLGVAYAEWVAKGYNPKNFDGIADWYLGNRKNGSKKTHSRNGDNSESVRQAGDRLRANAKHVI